MNIFNNPYFNAIRNINKILDADQKRKSIIMIALLFINAIFDVFGLVAIFPLINAALNPQAIQTEWYLKYPYDYFGVQDTIGFLLIMSAIIFTIFVIKNLLSLFIYYIQSRFSFNISLRLSQKMFQYYYGQGFLFITGQDTGKKNYDIITVPFYFATYYLLETLILSTEILVLIIIFVVILLFDPLAVVLLSAIILPTFAVVYQLTKMRTKAIGDKRNILAPQATAILIDSLNAYNDVKLSNKEAKFFNTFSDVLKKINTLDALQQGIYGKIHQRLNDIVLGLGLLVIFTFAWFFRENLTQILALLSVFGLAAYRFLPSVNRIMGSALTLKNVSYLISELKVIANTRLKTYNTVKSLPFNDRIRLEKVSFAYDGNESNVLEDISFEIKKGETVGIIGSSGSGKTTLLNLFLRFITENNGAIYVDDNMLKSDNQASFQKIIGYVQQNVYIKNGTLSENIAFGESVSEIDQHKLMQSIKDSMLEDFVAQHQEGLDMPLGENGVKLSGGQRQRVGIARALYKDAKILVFDEATSALDPETEKSIVTTIHHLAELDKTIIIVAHRITTLEMCDRIYELEKGKIIGIHQYNEVLDRFIHHRDDR